LIEAEQISRVFVGRNGCARKFREVHIAATANRNGNVWIKRSKLFGTPLDQIRRGLHFTLSKNEDFRRQKLFNSADDPQRFDNGIGEYHHATALQSPYHLANFVQGSRPE
jgi:hypothetical protein